MFRRVCMALLAFACMLIVLRLTWATYGGARYWRETWFAPRVGGLNAPIEHPERMGVVPSLYAVREALLRYMDGHAGQLPADVMELAPDLALPVSAKAPVSPATLLPHVVVVKTGDPPPLAVGPGRFVLLVRVERTGPMHRDVVVAIGETGVGFREQYLDDQVVALLGDEVHRRLVSGTLRSED